MPVSRNKKDHKRRIAVRKDKIERRKKELSNMYRDMYKELTGKNESMIEMLNKEDMKLKSETLDVVAGTQGDPLYIQAPPLVEPVWAVSQSVELSPEELEISKYGTITEASL